MSEESATYQFGDWLVEIQLNRIRRDGEERQLEPRTMDVLAYFLERPGQVVTFDELLDGFWRGRIVNEGTIHRRIRQVRRILGDDARNPEYIETIRKRGYRTIGHVRTIAAGEEATADLRVVLESQTPPFPAYEGNEPYVFVCYAHADRSQVYPELIRLRDAGVNIWYDEGISPGSEWTEELAKAIADCSRFLYFISPSAVASSNCRDEVQYAREAGKAFVTVYLEPTELSEGLRLEMGRIQALFKYEMREADYRRKLDSTLRGSSPPSAAEAEPAVVPVPAPTRSRLAYLGIAALMVLAVVAAFVVRSGVFDAPTPTVAVMPFENMTGDPEMTYFADGLAVEILERLSQNSELNVISRSSSFWFRGRDAKLEEVGRALGATYLIEGSVRRHDGRVRVTNQLVEVATGMHVWSESYDDVPSNVFAFQESVGESIADALQVQLDRHGPLPTDTAESVAAYDQYLLGQHAMGDLSSFPGAASIAKARRHYESAMELDPDLDVARIAMARTYLEDEAYRVPVASTTTKIENRVASKTSGVAMVLSPAGVEKVRSYLRPTDARYPEFHIMEADLLRYPEGDKDWEKVEGHFREALKLDPNSVEALTGLAVMQGGNLADSEKIELLEKAHGLDPVNASTTIGLAMALQSQEEDQRAKEVLLEAYRLNPTYYAKAGNGTVLFALSQRFYEEDRLDSSLAWLFAGIDANPDVPMFPMMAAGRLYEIGDVEAAAQHFERFVSSGHPIVEEMDESGVLSMFEIQFEVYRGNWDRVRQAVSEQLPTIADLESYDRAQFEERLIEIMMAVNFSRDPEVQKVLSRLLVRVLPVEERSADCMHWITVGQACLNQDDEACARSEVDRAFEACPDLDEWDLTKLAVADRVYPDRFEAALTEAIAEHEIALDGLIEIEGTYEYQFLLERGDFQEALGARFAELHAMRDRFHAALAADDLEPLLFPD